MSKKFTSMFALVATGSLLLAACGNDDGNAGNTENGPANEVNEANDANEGNNGNAASGDVDVNNLQLGTGSVGGTYYPLGQEMATTISNNIEGFDGFDLSAVSSGASVDNIVGILQGEMDLGMTVHLPAVDSLTGAGDFEGVEVDNFGFMGHIYPEVMQIVTTADSGIESIADLEGASINIGPPGSGTQAAARLILEAYGLEDGDYEPFEEGFGDAAGRLQDGNLDASFGLLGLPDSSIEELSISRDITLIPISDEGMAYIEENSGYGSLSISADSYDFLEEDVQAMTAYAVLVGSTDTISEDLGYAITKALFENSGDITHPQGANLTTENALLGSDDLPMHPGAERYFEEAGILE
ncbi:TAXI family TRAP transporter solute-binding subunit [Paenalkalicoccus suaedae]|uniref:TAXI family TRAP transporter solute-binding subunit n=1 Tax=Paenalkalicoccus suaedae TaxID=2592382 RepID=A0A859FG49_9BACI|nr:TAXI family TRAP transporter solute-binding subunit [Paenalkalicoccus suaedae]QKS71800.1 TAXI family TRAP transporter solute-binding subunit [Paenalkalicoccus suaedae]